MSIWRTLSRGFRALTHREAADQDTADEIAHYLELATAAHVRRGLSAEAARRAAQLEIGNATVAREQVRAFGWENVIEAIVADVRHSASSKPARSRRCSATSSDPGLTLKTPRETCSTRRVIPNPCIGWRLSVLRMSMSSVPWMTSLFGSSTFRSDVDAGA